MFCMKCGVELEENQPVCPACGWDSRAFQEQLVEMPEEDSAEMLVDGLEDEAEDDFVELLKEQKPKRKPLTKKQIVKLVLSLVAGVLVVALVAGIVVLATRKNDVYYKNSYAVSDFWAKLGRDTVVATMGDYELTNGQFQVFYWMQVYDLISYYTEQYGDYATYYMGLDLDKPFSEQIYNKQTGMTWEQYFIEDAFYAWHRYQALTDEAEKRGFRLSVEYQQYFDNLRSTLEKKAEEGEYESVDAMLQGDLGSCVTFDDYYNYLRLYYISNLYFDERIASFKFTDAELEAYYQENEEVLRLYGISKDSGLLIDLRNILVKPVSTKDANGNSVVTDEAWEDCRDKAQAIIQQWQSGELTENSFAELAKQKSEDKNTAEQGGLRQYVSKNSLTTVDVRHILITPKGGTKGADGYTITYSEEEWEACRVEAQSILDMWLAGDQTEAYFGELANEYSADNNGKVTNGGIYTDINKGDMVSAFDAWIFDDSRQAGDTGLVKTEYGYHVMYFVHRDGAVEDWAFAQERKPGHVSMVKTDAGYEILYYVTDIEGWVAYCREGLVNESAEELMESCANSRPMETRYWATFVSQPTYVGD